jgi:replication factor A1
VKQGVAQAVLLQVVDKNFLTCFKMKISELKTKQGNVDIEVEVKSIEEPRSFNKFGKELRVANALVADDSGEIKLTLWNDEIDKVSVGSKVKITNGFVNEFQGEKQLTAGKFGKLEVM